MSKPKPAPLPSGTVVGGYQVIKKLAAGGFGVVYLCEDSERHLVALYILTVADIRGTSPKVWNGWKAKLLEDLFLMTRQRLSGETREETEAGPNTRRPRDEVQALHEAAALRIAADHGQARLVADDALDSEIDADLRKPAREEQRVGVGARGPEELGSDGDDFSGPRRHRRQWIHAGSSHMSRRSARLA